jgi:penicillin-binding protein 1A
MAGPRHGRAYHGTVEVGSARAGTMGGVLLPGDHRFGEPPWTILARVGSRARGAIRPLLRFLRLPVRLVAILALGSVVTAAGMLPLAVGVVVGARTATERIADLWFGPLTVSPGARRSTIFAADGTVLQHVYRTYNRAPVPLRRVRPVTRRAVLAIEDQRFYQHLGVDAVAIIRAFRANVRAGEIVQGGSTITQQLAELAFLGPTVTFEDKLREAWAAIRLDRSYPKDRILEMYLNRIHLGEDLYGLAAASRYYFGVPPSRLTLAQSAVLAGMIAAPARYDPLRHPRAATARRNVVLGRMRDLGWTDEPGYRRASGAPLGLSDRDREAAAYGPTTFFEQYVIHEFLSDGRLGPTYRARRRLLFRGGVKVYTTLQPQLQRSAERVLEERMTGRDLPQSAIVSVEPGTGAIRTMAVGNWPFGRRRYNLATTPGGGRSPGSAFKVFTLAAALQEGIPPSRVYNGNSPKTIPRCGGGETWTVSNAEPGGGSYTLAQATVHSVNAVFAQVINDVGPERVAEVAHRMGIRGPLAAVCPLTLGTSAVSPLEMTVGVSTLAAGGIRCEPRAIRKVVSSSGEVLLGNRPRCRRVLPAEVADLETAILEEVIRSGTGTAAAIGRPAAGKTGTAQTYRDAWFVGYVPQLATGVWVGHAQAEIPMPSVPGYGTGYGGVLAAPLWGAFMAQATRDLPVVAFSAPPQQPFRADEGPAP